MAFLSNTVGPLPLAQAQALRLPVPGAMVHLSPEFTPAHLQGITIHPDNALQFDFLIHRGEQELTTDQKKQEYKKLVKYFLASLTIPDEDQWVNLSPYEKDRIIKDDFGKTVMGRDLLAQDYLLKQLTSSLIYPENGLGKKFWDKIYERAWREYHTTELPVNTFNKVWIVPDHAYVYESGNSAYILQSHLKVMLEEDYLSLKKHSAVNAQPTHTIGSEVIREIVLPALEKEVNEGENFANLRQMYSGMVLATWYKRALKESLLGKVYADKAKVAGVDQDPKANEEIYQRYLKAFKKGVFNYIKDDVDRYTNESIPRKYFSGGFSRFDPAMVGHNDVVIVRSGEALPKGLDLSAMAASKSFLDRAMVVFNAEGERPSGDEVVPSVSNKIQMPNNIGLSVEKFEEIRDQIDELLKSFEAQATDLVKWVHNGGPSPFPFKFYKNSRQAPKTLTYRYNRNFIKALKNRGLLLDDGSNLRPEVVTVIKRGYSNYNVNTESVLKHEIFMLVKGKGEQTQVSTDIFHRVVTSLEKLSYEDRHKIIAKAYKNEFFNDEEMRLFGRQFFHQGGEYEGHMFSDVRSIIEDAAMNSEFEYTLVEGSNIERNKIETLLSTLAGEKDVKNLVIMGNIYSSPWGSEILSLGILTKSVFLQWPGIEKVYVITQFPEIVTDIDPRVQVINPGDSDKLPQVPIKAILNFGSDEDTRLIRQEIVAKSTEKPIQINNLKLLFYLHGFEIGNIREEFRKELGRYLKVPSLSEPLLKAHRGKNPSVIFINPHGVTNQDNLADSHRWVDLIMELVYEGFTVRISRGVSSEDSAFTDSIVKELVTSLRVSKATVDGLVEKFDSRMEMVHYMAEHAKAVITQDSAPFHVAFELLGIPVVVLTTHSSLSWVPEEEDGFGRLGRVEKYEFMNVGGQEKVIDKLRALLNPVAAKASQGILEDAAMGSIKPALSNVKSPFGGIDFNSANLGLQIKRDGRGVPLPLVQQDMAQLSRIRGFNPEIIEIEPAVNVPILNELQQGLRAS
jgi:hypothetical protein